MYSRNCSNSDEEALAVEHVDVVGRALNVGNRK